jgi:tripartite-type tricarboxylate transporter receptor subunit TctC
MRARAFISRTCCALIGALGLCVASTGDASAADAAYPNKPIHLIVPFPAGGGADNLARAIMPGVSKVLG